MWVRYLAWLSGLRIWRWHRLQMRLRFRIAMAVVLASSGSPHSALSLELPYAEGGAPKKEKRKERGKKRRKAQVLRKANL